MPAQYSDNEIQNMVSEGKQLPQNYQSRIRLRDKTGHKERELDVTGDHGNKYRIILRQSDFNQLDFSVILAIKPPKSNQLFRLRRYNGKSHEHTNQIEGNTFYDFHIHKATERYQDWGGWEDAFAEPTRDFSDYHSAVRCFLKDCGFRTPDDEQQKLFEDFHV